MFGWMHPHHRSLTVLMSPHEYDKWSDKFDMGIHFLQWSQHAQVLVEGGDDLGLMTSATFHTKVECVWMDAPSPLQLDIPNVTL